MTVTLKVNDSVQFKFINSILSGKVLATLWNDQIAVYCPEHSSVIIAPEDIKTIWHMPVHWDSNLREFVENV